MEIIVLYYSYKLWGIKVVILVKNKILKKIIKKYNYGWSFKSENNLCDIGVMDFCMCFGFC